MKNDDIKGLLAGEKVKKWKVNAIVKKVGRSPKFDEIAYKKTKRKIKSWGLGGKEELVRGTKRTKTNYIYLFCFISSVSWKCLFSFELLVLPPPSSSLIKMNLCW